MKRYNIHGAAASQGRELKNQPYTAYKDPEGLWVKWEDVKDIIQCDICGRLYCREPCICPKREGISRG